MIDQERFSFALFQDRGVQG